VKDIIISKNGPGDTYNIEWGDLYEDRLAFDEALGVVAKILTGGEPRYLRSTTQRYNDVYRVLSREPLHSGFRQEMLEQIHRAKLTGDDIESLVMFLDMRIKRGY
jgi:hypothetical protein